MHPVQLFRANFAQDEVTDEESDKPVGYAIGSTELYDTGSSVRNLYFVWEDGRRTFFNYSDLAWGDLMLTDSVNVLLLYFGGQVVTLKGYQLRSLFELLSNHIPKTITARNPRYYIDKEAQPIFVTEIHIRSE
ncbi:hypothetical protein [Spirosoma foliorum]|uniref:Uncharacterized protein n=1 Tax=Spirosoma foliorum TaxID=2710596 RepID=A0A7G5H2X0_9BACT|nr:hypothetical protein [Spirosoma foliorum]QMW05462.1 hypothetical protein H3H32_11515 [Spirosoma foliorum]